MYVLVIIAFVIYITKVPERWFVGKVDWCGHSHNWWHLFVLAALYYWHNSGKLIHLYWICQKHSSLTFLHMKKNSRKLLHAKNSFYTTIHVRVDWPLEAETFSQKHNWRAQKKENKGWEGQRTILCEWRKMFKKKESWDFNCWKSLSTSDKNYEWFLHSRSHFIFYFLHILCFVI